jgi:hypothetical protein
MSSRRLWEHAVLFPGRVVSLPLSGLGHLVGSSLLYLENTGRIPTGPRAPREERPRLVVFGPPSLGDRAGLGGAVELRSPPSMRAMPLMSARYAGSITDYNSTRLRAWRGPATLQYGYDWRPTEQFYGVGNSTSSDSVSNYAMQDEFVRGTLSWGWRRSATTESPRVMVSAWGGPRSRVTRTGRETDEVSYDVLFPALGSTTLDRRVEHLVYGGDLSIDWRSGRPHWSRGGRVVIGAERYDEPIQALALHSSQSAGAQFTRYSFETEVGASIMRDPRTVRLKLKLTDVDVSAGEDQFLPSDMSRLGGRHGVSGYGSGRFHDLDMLCTKVMFLIPLARWFEADLHSEWGAVYSDIWKEAKPGTLKSSFGFSLRGRSSVTALGSVGVDFSRDGARIRYAFGDVE